MSSDDSLLRTAYPGYDISQSDATVPRAVAAVGHKRRIVSQSGHTNVFGVGKRPREAGEGGR